MNKYLIFVLFWIIPFSAHAERWTLDRCIEHALKHNKTIRAHNENIISDSARIIQARSVFYPDLSAGAGTRISDAPFAQTNANQNTNPNGTVSFDLSSRVTLFDGRKNINRFSIAEKTLEQDKTILNREIRDMISLVARSYISVLYATETLNNAKETVALSQKQLEYQQALSEVGKATQLALSRSSAQLSRNKYSQTSAQNAFDAAILQIKNLLELDWDTDFEVSDTLRWERGLFSDVGFSIIHPDGNKDIDLDKIAYLSEDSVFEYYSKNFVSEIYAAQLSVEIAQTSLEIAKAGKTPALSASGSISTGASSKNNSAGGGGQNNSESGNNQSNNSANEQLKNQLSYSLGLSLNVPIVDNRSTKSSIIIAQSNLNKAKISLETARQNIRSQIAQLVADVNSSSSRFVSAKEQFLAETENMRTIEEMYGMGNITAIDYASQQNSFLSAQSELTQAKYSLMLSQKLLEIYLTYN